MAQLTRVWDQMVVLNWHQISFINIIGTINESFFLLGNQKLIPRNGHKHIQEEREVGRLAFVSEIANPSYAQFNSIHNHVSAHSQHLVSQSEPNAQIKGWVVTIVHN